MTWESTSTDQESLAKSFPNLKWTQIKCKTSSTSTRMFRKVWSIWKSPARNTIWLLLCLAAPLTALTTQNWSSPKICYINLWIIWEWFQYCPGIQRETWSTLRWRREIVSRLKGIKVRFRYNWLEKHIWGLWPSSTLNKEIREPSAMLQGFFQYLWVSFGQISLTQSLFLHISGTKILVWSEAIPPGDFRLWYLWWHHLGDIRALTKGSRKLSTRQGGVYVQPRSKCDVRLSPASSRINCLMFR